jgi:alkanesulfonate monooxygenase SsuD/methylene tetrahydromethanopterin reductase-like flavin-dependent oxidoreductase (luciferase family)
MIRLGYLLPTRELVMQGKPETAPLLKLAEQAEGLGFDSLWVGDSLTARPRHEPLALLAAVAARTSRAELGTAVLLPALRNPVLLAHQVATLDQISEGRFILGIGIASDVQNIRDEFMAAGVPWEGRVGRLVEGMKLCQALWSGEKVNWDGRWQVKDAVLGPVPFRKGGPPIWMAASVPAAQARLGKHFDGWFPNGPQPADWTTQWAGIQDHARAAGRDPGKMTGALYLTMAIDEDAARADDRLNDYLSSYYGQRPDSMRKRQASFAGPATEAAEWLDRYVKAGVEHMVLRFAGDPLPQMEAISRIRRELGW